MIASMERSMMYGGGRMWTTVVIALLFVAISSCAGEPRLATPGSTHPSFPLDAFAKPAYKVIFQDDQPVGNETALEILRAGRAGDSSSLDLSDTKSGGDASQDGTNRRPAFKAYLHRTSAQVLHICTLAEAKQSHAKTTLQLDESTIDEYRAGVLRRALSLLAPLKSGCLFHTHDWFTYSFCHGDALRQFHALPSTLGGGKTPAMDPTQDSYVLGRWRAEAETVQSPSAGEAEHELRTVSDRSAYIEEETDSVDDTESGQLAQSLADEEQAGTHLMELVHFSSIEDNRHSPADEGARTLTGSNTVEGKGRYISQYWSDGTLCNINNEPRSTEVQFHCAKTPPVDRIALIKEVTTCSYVIVIETPRLCEEPALAQVEDEVEEVHCRPILSDEAIQQRYRQHIRETHASLIEGAKQATDKTTHENAGLDGQAQEDTQEQVDTSSLESQLYSIFEKLTNTKLPPGKPLMEEVEVVVGMDEDGNLILEPRSDRIGARVSDQDTEIEHERFYESHEDLMDGHGEKSDATLPAEKIAEVVQRIKDMGLLGSEGAIVKVIQADGDDGTINDGFARQEGDTDTTLSQATVAGQRTPQTAGQNAAQRGNLMARETESFAQRVDRLYRAQEEAVKRHEADKTREGNDQEKETEEGRGRREAHVEL